MAFGGANPLAQVLNIAVTDGATVRYSVAVATAKGASWLAISPSGNACCYTPLANTISVNAGSIAAGAYTADIIITEYANPGRAMVVPVTLTVLSSGAFFADLPGQLSFSVKTNGTTATPQTIQVGNGGSGTLNWNPGHQHRRWRNLARWNSNQRNCTLGGFDSSPMSPSCQEEERYRRISRSTRLQNQRRHDHHPVTVTVGAAPFHAVESAQLHHAVRRSEPAVPSRQCGRQR